MKQKGLGVGKNQGSQVQWRLVTWRTELELFAGRTINSFDPHPLFTRN